MKKKVIGIILVAIGVLALLGGFANGNWANLADENIVTAATEVILLLACFIGGIVLIVKSKKDN